jgi:hypothetical protein
MIDHIPDVTKMVPDGYYTALVQCDTGGEISMHVRVLDGIPRNARGASLRADACRDYMPVCVEDFCRAWPWDAAMELSALRAGNAALVEEVERLQAWRDSWVDIESKWDAPAIAVMLGGKIGESTRAVIAREVPRLVERVKRLEEAGDIMATWAPLDRVITWTKAKATP